MKKSISISLFILIFYIFRAPTLTSNIIKFNFGFSNIFIFEYYPYFFFLIPALILLSQKGINNKLKLPYFISYIIIASLFFLFESNFIRENIITDLTFLYQLTLIYSYFLVLVNIINFADSRYYIIKYSIIVILYMNIINYLGFFQLINFGTVNPELLTIGLVETRFETDTIQPNGLSVNSLIGIVLLMIGRKQNIFGLQKNQRFLFLVVLFLGTILVNASRGVFIMAVLVFIVHLKYTWKLLNSNQKLILPLILFFVVFGFSVMVFSNIFLASRFQNTQIEEARFKQVYLSWENFVNNPILGVGYNKAGKGAWGLSRSNFSYTQILAANGIFYFLLYMHFLIKMFGFNYRKYNGLFYMIGGYMALMFYNLHLVSGIAVLAYLKYDDNRCLRIKETTDKNSQSTQLS